MLIKILLISFSLLSTLAFSNDKGWSIASSEKGFVVNSAEYGNSKLEMVSPTTPKIKEVISQPLFEVVVIDHGEVGTSCLVRIHKAYVFDKNKKELIGVYPYRVIAVDNKVKKCKVRPVNWEYYKNHILVHDKNSDKKFKITAQ